MKKKELEKRSVGRPKLADEKLMKEAKRQIYLVLVLLLVIISLSGLRLMSGIMPIGSLNNASNNKLAFSLFGPSISINVSGTERQKVGYGAANVVADTYPSSDTVTWTSSNPSVVKIIVGSNPKIITFYVVGVGTSTVTATSSSGKSDSFTIIGVSGDTVTSKISLSLTGTITRNVNYVPLFYVTATTEPYSNTVTWTSSNTNVATVTPSLFNNKKMKYKVVGAGEATITATSSSGATASFKIIGVGSTISNPSSSISLNISGTITRNVNYSPIFNIVATTTPSTDTVSWSSSNTNVATISVTSDPKKMKYKVVGAGEATITAASSSGKTASFKIIGVGSTISNPSSSISLNVSGTITYPKGTVYGAIVATTTPSTDTVKWTSSNSSIVKIIPLESSNKVNISFVGTGKATINAKSSGGKSASFIAVSTGTSSSVAEISISESGTETHKVGYSPLLNITATTKPSSDTVTWSSSNTGVATISVTSNPKKMKYKVVGVGEATITATSSSGKSASFKVVGQPNISNPPTTKISLSASGTKNYDMGISVGPIVAATTPSSDTVTWSTTNTHVIRIVASNSDSKRMSFSTIGAGEATITATSSSGERASFVVVVNAPPFEDISLKGYNNSKTAIIKSSKFLVENGCNATVIDKFKNLFVSMPDYLLHISEIHMLNLYTIRNNPKYKFGIANVIGFAFGTTGNIKIAVSCDTYNPSTAVHEAAHSWDNYYNLITGGGLMSSQVDYVRLYKSYLSKYNNGDTYFSKYSYVNSSAVGMEFLAESYTVYYNNYIQNLGLSSKYNTRMPSDVKETIEGYIRATK